MQFQRQDWHDVHEWLRCIFEVYNSIRNITYRPYLSKIGNKMHWMCLAEWGEKAKVRVNEQCVLVEYGWDEEYTDIVSANGGECWKDTTMETK